MSKTEEEPSDVEIEAGDEHTQLPFPPSFRPGLEEPDSGQSQSLKVKTTGLGVAHGVEVPLADPIDVAVDATKEVASHILPRRRASRFSFLRRQASHRDHGGKAVVTNYQIARQGSVAERSLPTLPLPTGIKICILIVGTHGDLSIFVGLALELQKLGHQVRVASHREHRHLVVAHEGLSFYPLAGDPHQLSKWMFQTGGTLLGEARNAHLLPEKTKVVKDIIRSAWPAVSQPDPDDPNETPFVAEAIIANPPVMGHIHVAEALGCPLHIMFPQPWYYATKSYPHPMSGLTYVGSEGRSINETSYEAFEQLTMASFGGAINDWRRNELELHEIRGNMARAVTNSQIPFSALWSPNFVPKPDDWPEQVRVVGAFQMPKLDDDKASERPKFDTTPFQYLLDWLEEGEPPIFCGFGSMVVSDGEGLSAIIHEAAALADVRIIVQGDWFIEEYEPAHGSTGSHKRGSSHLRDKLKRRFRRRDKNEHKSGSMSGSVMESGDMEAFASSGDLPESAGDLPVVGDPSGRNVRRCIKVGRCPHDWLLPVAKTRAVIHHGGAGTTAAGLRYGLPTLVCPFFADQFFWAEMVRRAGVGPAGCPVTELTTEKLVAKLAELKLPEMKVKAEEMSERMDQETGIANGLEHFFDSLPRDNMLCDVGVILGEVAKAKMRLYGRRGKGLKISLEVAALLRKLNRSRSVSYSSKFRVSNLKNVLREVKESRLAGSYGVHSLAPHAFVTYGLGRVETTLQGIGLGCFGLITWWVRAPFQLFWRPDKLARTHGACGCIRGLVESLFYVLAYLIYGFVVGLDRILTGISNGCCHTNRLFCIDVNAHYMVASVVADTCDEEIEVMVAKGTNTAREKELLRGLDLAIAARAIFDKAGPFYPDNSWHFQVANAGAIKDSLRVSKGELRLTSSEVTTLSSLLEKIDHEDVSFSALCALLHETISSRPNYQRSSRHIITRSFRDLSSRGESSRFFATGSKSP